MGAIIERLAQFTLQTQFEDLPETVTHETKKLLLDSIGCGLAGITTDPGKMIIALAKMLGGPPESSIIGTGDKVSCTNAALANGQLINALDFDTVTPGGHTPPFVVPPQLAMAERVGASGKELLLSCALGFEIAARVARATPPAMRFEGSEKIFKYTQREGYAKTNFGAAAGAARLVKLNQKQLINALATAGHLCQVLTWGRFNYAVPRNMTKYGIPGWQNTGAITAVLLAQMGFTGDIDLLDDSEHGFGEFCGYDRWEPAKITEGIGKTWYFTDVKFKRYACCGPLHRCIDGFKDILEKNNLKPEEIESVNASASPTVDAVSFTNSELNNIVDVQFGLPYVLAMVTYGQKPGADWQDWNKVTDPKIVEFAKRVSLKGDPEYGVKGLTTVEVVARGRTFKEELPGASPKLTDFELVAKYKHNASRILTLDKIEDGVTAILELEKLPSVSDLVTKITM